MSAPKLGDLCSARDGKALGVVVGFRPCSLSGCRYKRLGVRWPDGRMTWPCLAGCGWMAPGMWKIL